MGDSQRGQPDPEARETVEVPRGNTTGQYHQGQIPE